MEILKGSAKSISATSSILKLQQIRKSTVELQFKVTRSATNSVNLGSNYAATLSE
jgi:hypothetical protein